MEKKKFIIKKKKKQTKYMFLHEEKLKAVVIYSLKYFNIRRNFEKQEWQRTYIRKAIMSDMNKGKEK